MDRRKTGHARYKSWISMKFFRYRRPSLNTLLGITKAKKRIKKELGITEAMKPFRWWTNTKRRSSGRSATNRIPGG